MHVRVNQAWKNVFVAHIDNLRPFQRPVKRSDRRNPAISDFDRRSLDAARKNNTP
jgi:hypothetical protein